MKLSMLLDADAALWTMLQMCMCMFVITVDILACSQCDQPSRRYAVEDAETTYFNESHQTAKDAVAEATQLYQQVLNDLSEADRGKLQRSMGMKMEQLKVCRRQSELRSLTTVKTYQMVML